MADLFDNRFAWLTMAAIAFFAINGCADTFKNEPLDVEVVSSDAKHDVFLINGQADYGLKTFHGLRNNGPERVDVKAHVRVSCSEGEWEKYRTSIIDPGETKIVECMFTEPTVNSSNIEYRIRLSKAN